jgi:hypothetical protein
MEVPNDDVGILARQQMLETVARGFGEGKDSEGILSAMKLTIPTFTSASREQIATAIALGMTNFGAIQWLGSFLLKISSHPGRYDGFSHD